MMKNILRAAAALLITALAGCATPTFEETPSKEFGDANLYPVSGTGFTEAFARRDANLSSYRQVSAEDIDLSQVQFSGPMLSGTTGNQWQITERRGETLTEAWRSATDQAFKDYEQGQAGEKVLRITAQLTGVTRRNASFTGTLPPGVHSNRRDSVAISAEFRLYDLASGDLLAVIRDRRDRHTEEWTRASGMHMVNLFNSWAALLAARISG